MKILFIHPEGNLNYNTSLSGILDLLEDSGHEVTYVAPRRPAISQERKPGTVKILLLDNRATEGPLCLPELSITDDAEVFSPWSGFDLVMGVDMGAIEASRIGRHFRIPHALISYEIFFAAETSANHNDLIVEACQGMAFAVCQDEVRLRNLSLEYGIAPAKIVLIPVAGRGFRAASQKSRLFHQMFGLAPQTQVVLQMGSFADWTRAPYLLESTHHWDENWVLVIHERYGTNARNLDMIRKLGHSERVKLSRESFDNPDAMAAFIQSAALGIAMYHPTYEHKWVGRNIADIGLSSGKISTYLQHGVPVATHELGEISDLMRAYGAGQIFSLDEPFVPRTPLATSEDACRRLFENHLDLDRFGPRLLEAVRTAGAGAIGY
jgi:hypothetical protein